MKYPEPSVDLTEIRQKFHAEVVEELVLAASEPGVEEVQPKQKKSKKKGNKKKKK